MWIPNPEATGRVQDELGIDPKLCFSSLEDAAHHTEATLAICTLRTEAHYPVVKRCLELGYNVLVEKPFTTTIAQGKELVALAAAQGRVLMVSQNYRHQPAPIAAADLIAAGRFGALNMVSLDFRRHGPARATATGTCPTRSWRHVHPPLRPHALRPRRRAGAPLLSHLEYGRQPLPL